MRLKEDVLPTRLCPEILLALQVADSVYRNHGQELVITSLNDSKHSRSSLHYVGHAADLRTRYFSEEQIPLVVQELKESLGGGDYDVIFEGDHIHLEYQPKR